MKRMSLVVCLTLALTLLLAGCGCEHEWYVATCSAPKTCSLCGEAEGEALPHTWQDATCTDAKTCSVCKVTEGEPLGHTWQDATCTIPKTCSICKVTEGEPLGHTWQDATCTAPKTCSVCQATEGKVASHKWQVATTEAPKTCSVCQATEGSKLKTDPRFTTKATKELQGKWTCDIVMTEEMMDLPGFGNTECTMTLQFGNTGEMSLTATLKDEKGFLAKLRQHTINEMYAAFAQEGYTKEQGDQTMLDAYGLNVNDYVDAMLKNYDVSSIFDTLTSQRVYYVKDGALYTAISWKAKFEEDGYTLKNGKLVIDGITLEEGGTPLTWKKA